MARRSGGRQARHAQRSAPLAEELKPVRPGERGGQYQPFAKADLDAVVANIFRILEEVGFKDATPIVSPLARLLVRSSARMGDCGCLAVLLMMP